MVPRSLASSLSSVHSVVYSPERPSLRLNGAFDPEALPLSDIELSPVPSSLTSPGESERRYSPPSPVAPSPDRGPRAGHRAATRAKRVMFREPERSPGGGVHAWTGSTGRRGPGGASCAAHDPEVGLAWWSVFYARTWVDPVASTATSSPHISPTCRRKELRARDSMDDVARIGPVSPLYRGAPETQPFPPAAPQTGLSPTTPSMPTHQARLV